MYISAAGFSSITTCPLQFLNNFPSLFHLNKIISRLTICYFYIEGIRGARTFEPVTKTPRQTAKIKFLKCCTNNKRKENAEIRTQFILGESFYPSSQKENNLKSQQTFIHSENIIHDHSIPLVYDCDGRWVMNFCFV